MHHPLLKERHQNHVQFLNWALSLRSLWAVNSSWWVSNVAPHGPENDKSSSEMMNVIIPTSSQHTGKEKQYHYPQKTFHLKNREGEGPWRGEMTSCSVLEWSPQGTAWFWGPCCHTSRKQEEASPSGNTLLWHLSSCWHILKGWWFPLLRSIYGSLFRC